MEQLTAGQQAMWFAYQLNPTQTNFITAEYVAFRGEVSLQKLREAIMLTLTQAEALHQVYRVEGNQVYQTLCIKDVDVPIVELVNEAQQQQWMQAHLRRPLALEKGQSFETALLQNAQTGQVVWFFKVHHIAIDAYAYQLIYQATAKQYNALMASEAPLMDVFDAFTAVVEEEQHYTASADYEDDRAFWQHYAPVDDTLATFSVKQPTLTGDVIQAATTFSKEVVQQWKIAGFAKRIMPQHYFMAGFAILAYKVVHKKQIVLNTPLMQRVGSKAANVPCLHMNMVPLHIDVTPAATIYELAQQIQQQEAVIKQHGRFPYEQIRREIALPFGERLCSGQLNFMPFYETLPFVGAEATTHKLSIGVTDDLSFNLFATADGGLRCELLANADLYDEAVLETWLAYFERILTEADHRIYKALQQSVAPVEEAVHQVDIVSMIEQSVNKAPQALAISGSEKLTYEQLWQQSNQMANWLVSEGIQPNDFVALYVKRVPELISFMIAILKIRATYIPMDPIYPMDRIAYMVHDANARVMLCDQPIDLDVPQLSIAMRPWEAFPTQWNATEQGPHDAAYMIYTSGSTGKPKGVVIERHNLANFMIGMQERLPMTAQDRLLAVTTNAFDISMLECFLPLTVGAAVVLSDAADIHDPQRLAQLIQAHDITFLQATPSLWKTLVRFVPQALANVTALVGGEALSEALAARMLETTKAVYNMYGPTETTIWSTMAQITDATDITLGQPIAQTALYILDEDLQPVLDGSEGHLYIAGEGVGRGYYKRPALTAERFIANPFTEQYGRMYQTGDLVKRINGKLYYIGRTDFQVKVRGFRIELSEIEAALVKLAGVEEALVIAKQFADDTRLIAYVIGVVDEKMLQQKLAAMLPDYMVPEYWCAVTAWPLTANGKIDRNALPMPTVEAAVEEVLYTPLEAQVAALYKEVLQVTTVSRDSHFFRLGGHSILATTLMMRIREKWQVDLTIATIFEHPTVCALTAIIDQADGETIWPEMTEVPAQQTIALSATQRGMWFMQQTNPSATYNIPLFVEGVSYDLARVKQALAIVQQQHPILRTTYTVIDGRPVQQLVTQAIPVTLSTTTKQREDIHTIFDLAQQVSAKVFAYEDALLFLFHHIAIDGYGLSIFLDDFAYAYEQLEPRTAPMSYGAYVAWQEHLLARDVTQQGLDYWGQQLAHVPDEITLPYEETTSDVAGAHAYHELSATLMQKLQQLAQTQGVSLYTVLQTGFSMLLTKMGAGDDVTIGSPTNGRPVEALQHMLGLMMNTVVYRYEWRDNLSFAEALQATHHMNQQAYKYDFVPFDQVVERVNPRRTGTKNPLFQVMLTMQNNPALTLTLEGQQAHVRLIQTDTAKVELALEFDWREEALAVIAEYDATKFTAPIIEDLLMRFEQVLDAVSSDAQLTLTALSLLLPHEQTTLLTQAVTEAKHYAPATIVARFEQMAIIYAEQVAVTYEGQTLTYRQLNERANQLARHLQAQGVKPRDYVALIMERGLDMLVGLVAVLKTGAAYVPIDPHYPTERIHYILESANPRFIVVDEPRGYGAEMVMATLPFEAYETDNIEVAITPQHPAYVIYTSGSTGKPKGVVIPHNNVIRLLDATDDWYHFSAADSWTFFHSYAFDFSIWEIWGALLTGAKLVVVPFDVSRTPSEFHRLLIDERVTVLNQTPSAFYQLIEADQATDEKLQLRTVIFGGEALSFNRLRKWYAKYKEATTLINMYGITETTVHVSYQVLSEELVTERQASLIGEAIPDLEIYVLDAMLQPVPAGVVGEMYVAGDGLAHGYLGRPALTAERFIANPFKTDGSRMYRTGDLAKWTADGNLAYIGRIDHQVKIRGFRIELEEIERALLAVAGVREAVAVVKKYSEDDVRIFAYVIADDWQQATATKQISSVLPSYMMPNAFIEITEMPLTPNGKLDTKALPEPQYASTNDVPTNPTEEVMLQLFRDVLGNQQIGIHDSFFEVGGHSLLAVQLMTSVKQTFDMDLTIGHLFEAPTVAKLCLHMEDLDEKSSLQSLLPLRKNEGNDNLFCVHPAGGLSWCYAGLMQHLPQQQALYGLQAVGIAEAVALPKTLIEMAAGYITEMKRVQPEGPYELLGWSLGGNVVQEMAVQLEAKGEQAHLIVLDAYPVHHKMGDQTLEEEAVEALLALGGLDVELIEGEPTLENVLALLKKEGSALASLSIDTLQRLLKTYMNSITLLRAHEPRRSQASMLFYQSTILPEWFEAVDPRIWQNYIDNIDIYKIACRHKDMCQPEPIREIGAKMADYFTKKGMIHHV